MLPARLGQERGLALVGISNPFKTVCLPLTTGFQLMRQSIGLTALADAKEMTANAARRAARRNSDFSSTPFLNSGRAPGRLEFS